MANSSRQKGTVWEKEILETWLWRIWPTAKRAPNMGINDYGDFINVDDWLVEAKNRKNIRLSDWVNMVYTKITRRGGKIGKAPWVIVFKGDRRTWMKESMVLSPAWLFFAVLERAKLYEDSLKPPDSRTTEEWLSDIRSRSELESGS